MNSEGTKNSMEQVEQCLFIFPSNIPDTPDGLCGFILQNQKLFSRSVRFKNIILHADVNLIAPIFLALFL